MTLSFRLPWAFFSLQKFRSRCLWGFIRIFVRIKDRLMIFASGQADSLVFPCLRKLFSFVIIPNSRETTADWGIEILQVNLSWFCAPCWISPYSSSSSKYGSIEHNQPKVFGAGWRLLFPVCRMIIAFWLMSSFTATKSSNPWNGFVLHLLLKLIIVFWFVR